VTRSGVSFEMQSISNVLRNCVSDINPAKFSA
jgi:hypothetical protein